VEWLATVLAACEMSAKGEALMSLSPRKIGSIVLVLVLVHLFAPAAYALPPSGPQGAFRSGDTFAAVWEWLGSLLVPNHEKPVSQWEGRKAGSQMDGLNNEDDFVSVACEAGSHMDPDGDK
jgi:hypothetical protein